MLSVLDLLFCNDNDDMCISYSSFQVLGFAGLCRTASIVTTTVKPTMSKPTMSTKALGTFSGPS